MTDAVRAADMAPDDEQELLEYLGMAARSMINSPTPSARPSPTSMAHSSSSPPQAAEKLARRERRVQEKADESVGKPGAEEARHEHEVIVMNPDLCAVPYWTL